MPLADEIRSLRDRTLGDLDAAHDYHVDSQTAWRIVRDVVKSGMAFANQNTATGTVTSQTDLVAKAQRYLAQQLPEATFQQFLAIFESFVFDFLRLWISAYPQGLFRKMVDFKSVWEAADKDAITRLVVARELNEVLCERPAGWFAYLEERAKLGCPTAEVVGRIAEAKATRDVLAHNQGIANKTYETKAGKDARFSVGDRVEIPEDYHRETWALIRRVVADVADAGIEKVG